VAADLIPTDVVVIGGGPGGYVASIRAAQLGLTTVCVEMDKTLGGTCVNVGCIPSKALLTSSEHFEFAKHAAAEHGVVIPTVSIDLAQMMKRKNDVVGSNTKGVEFLFKKNKVTWARGAGTLTPGNVVDVTAADGTVTRYQARNVIIATGSSSIELPFLRFDETRVVSNIGALTLKAVPKTMIVVGGGAIGLELGSVWRRLGADVTVVEFMPTILPGNDDDIIKEATRVFTKQGLTIRTGSKVTAADLSSNEVIRLTVEKDGVSEVLEADVVLVSVGRRPLMHGIDAAALGLELQKNGAIKVDDQLRTNLAGVYAIGDVAGGKLLAHKAEDEGMIAAEVIAGKKVHMHYAAIPGVVYTWPEIAAVGLTEGEIKASGRAYTVGKFPFSANGRARCLGETTGFVKIIADAATDELLGCHILGANAGDLIQEIVLAVEYKGSAEDIAITTHAHPTLGETVKEAALAALGRAIHI